MQKSIIFFASVVLVMLFSCKKEEYKLDMHYDYFPMQKGTYQIYDVVERNYLSNGQVNQLNYQLKTIIADTFIGNGGLVNYEFHRYKRPTANDEWTFSDLWTTYRSGNTLELVEENERIIKLIFPITKSATWDANAYNVQGTQKCAYQDLFQPKTINGLNFDKTVTVMQEDEYNLIMYRKKFEVYAEGVGLVQKHYQHYNISYFDTTNIETGKELYYSIVSHGVQ